MKPLSHLKVMKTLTIFSIQEKFPIFSQQMKKFQFVKKSVIEPEKLKVVIIEIKYTLISFKFAEKIFTLF